MKRAVGVLELIIVLVVILVLFFTFTKSTNGRKNQNPFEEVQNIEQNQQIVDDKINEIENAKQLRERIENNLEQEF